MSRKPIFQFLAGAAVLLISSYLRFRGAAVLSWLLFAAGAILMMVGLVRIYRSRRKDDSFARFVRGTILSNARSPLFCSCGHELRVHTFGHDELHCSRCEFEGVSQQCALSERSSP